VKIQENIRKECVDKKAGKTYGSGCNDPAQKAVDAMRDNDKNMRRSIPVGTDKKLAIVREEANSVPLLPTSQRPKKVSAIQRMSLLLCNLVWHIQLTSTLFTYNSNVK
jgi:hypothetical protein